MSFRSNNPFNRLSHFDPESRLSEFRKRFENLSQNTNPMFDSKLGNRWPNGLVGHSMSKSKRSDEEVEGIPIKVIHEKSDERPNFEPKDDKNFDKNSDSMSSFGSSQSHRSGDTSHSSGSIGSVFHRNQSPSESGSGSGQPRVHHIPITVEPRQGSTSSGYTSETNVTNGQPLSRSSSHSSAHSVGSSGQTVFEKRSPSPAKSVSSEQSNESNTSKPRVCQIPIKIETNGNQRSSPLDDMKTKVKTKGLGQSKEVPNKPKSGPFVTRIPVVSQTPCPPKPNESTPELNEEFVPKVVQKEDPLELINKILSDLKKYEVEVNQFEGTAVNKQYKYLDEMLTRFMIKLDTIETNGSEDVRKARKAAIIAVNKCIACLDQKVDKSVEQTVQSMDISTPEPSDQNRDQKLNEEPMDSSETQSQNITNTNEQNDSQTEVQKREDNCLQSNVNDGRKETAV